MWGKIGDQRPKRAPHDQLRQRIVVHAGRHSHVLRDEGDESGSDEPQRRSLREDGSHRTEGDDQQAGAEQNGEQAQGQQCSVEKQIDRRCHQVVERRLMIFVRQRVV